MLYPHQWNDAQLIPRASTTVYQTVDKHAISSEVFFVMVSSMSRSRWFVKHTFPLSTSGLVLAHSNYSENACICRQRIDVKYASKEATSLDDDRYTRGSTIFKNRVLCSCIFHRLHLGKWLRIIGACTLRGLVQWFPCNALCKLDPRCRPRRHVCPPYLSVATPITNSIGIDMHGRPSWSGEFLAIKATASPPTGVHCNERDIAWDNLSG